MNLSELFIRRPIATSLLMAAIALFGIVAYRALPVSDLPQVDYPTLNVSAGLPGGDPSTMASAVTTRGGLLCASSCSSHFGKDEFLASIEAGARQAGRRWVFEALYGAAKDHPVLPAFPEGDYLKFAIGRVL